MMNLKELKEKLLKIKDLIMNSNSDHVDKSKNKYYDKLITIPNIISFARILGSVGICTWIGVNGITDPLLLGGLIAGVSLSDAVDGFIARKYNMQSKWGKRLDPIADKGLGIGLSVILCLKGLMNPLPTILIATRDLSAVGLFIKEKGQISVNNFGRAKTWFQSLGILSTVMFGYNNSNPLSMIAPVLMWSAVATVVPEVIKLKKDYYPSKKDNNTVINGIEPIEKINNENKSLELDKELINSKSKELSSSSFGNINDFEQLYSSESLKNDLKVLRF